MEESFEEEEEEEQRNREREREGEEVGLNRARGFGNPLEEVQRIRFLEVSSFDERKWEWRWRWRAIVSISSILRWISFPFLERERERQCVRQWEWDFCLMDLVWFGGNLRENRVSKACFKYISNDVYKATSYLVNRFTAKDFCWHMTVIVGMDDFYLDKILYFL